MGVRLGIHMAQKGGFAKNLKWVAEIGCKTVQLFPGNPKAWNLGNIDLQVIEQNKNLLGKYDIKPLVVHSPYLINLASSNNEVLKKSKALLNDTMARAAMYGAPFVVVHTGNHGGQGVEKGLRQVIDSISALMPTWPDSVQLVLENTAGSGTAIGSRLEELAQILAVFPKDSLGICLDTAHLWAAGYDISSQSGVASMFGEYDTLLGIDSLKLIHVNDTYVQCGAKVDRHAHIGEGEITREGFRAILNYGWPVDFPFILETPENGTFRDKDNLSTLSSLLDE